ncbi:MAG: PEGA domain-containing protein [Polyangiaceae bacterium]
MSRALAFSRWVRLVAELGTASSLVLAAPPASAQVAKKGPVHRAAAKSLSQALTGSAKADFEAAKLLANDGDFAGALIKFQSAYDTSKDPRLLWNVAFCEKNLRHYAKVISTLERYVAEGGATLSAGDKKDARDLIATIEPFTTRATFRVSPDGADVFIDDEHIGTSPLAVPVVLDIGERRLRIVKDGFQPNERTLTVGGRAEVTVDVALEKEVHEGKLIVDAQPFAAIFVDDKQVGIGKIAQSIASGGHQLRVTAPGMRPYQTEVVIQDKETRSVSVALEPETAADKPTLRVAVGCDGGDPKGPDDGLVVYVDGPDVLPPGPVKKRRSDALGTDVVERVEYPITPGTHTIKVSIKDCLAHEQLVRVDPTTGADVTGQLELDRFVLFRGPQGAPGGFHMGLGPWLSAGNAHDSVPDAYSSQGLAMTGLALNAGIEDRWFGLTLDAGYAAGTFHRATSNSHYLLPDAPSATRRRLALRFGPRLPFNVVSIAFGPSLGVEELDIDQVRSGNPNALIGGFGEIDVQPLCDWGLFAIGGAEMPSNNDDAFATVEMGVLFQPNAQCRREHATIFGLR